MEFFTPNGDGINDIWKISGLLENNQEDILLQVYDRYGKLLASLRIKTKDGMEPTLVKTCPRMTTGSASNFQMVGWKQAISP
jgi:gliding motility-associated-like protein